ncbi:MAG: alpha/beta hydrolase, partial [candidate division Zixibacteria bacterium]|nr:alpha/beta hydrolase [candidate division Zixibacteria bacterium]
MINVLKILLAVGVLALLFYFYVRYLERRTTYLPSRIIESNPSSIGLNYEDIYFETSDNIRLNGWFIPSVKTKLTLIFCHGNGGNISHRMDKILFFNKLGLNQFIFDYRGYGLSQGTPSEDGIYRDVEAAYQFIESHELPNQQIIVYGASLGGAVAVDLASKQPVDGLILEGTFSSAVDISREFYPLIPTFMVNLKFDSFAKIQNINIPKLIMHS